MKGGKTRAERQRRERGAPASMRPAREGRENVRVAAVKLGNTPASMRPAREGRENIGRVYGAYQDAVLQ